MLVSKRVDPNRRLFSPPAIGKDISMLKIPRRLVLSGAACTLAPGLAIADAVSAKGVGHFAVGASFPLSGSYALVGNETLRGIGLAVDQINKEDGGAASPVRVFEADLVDESAANATATRLIASNHIRILMGTGSSALAYPATAAAELAQTPYIEVSAPADGLMERGFRSLFRIGPSTRMIADAVADFIATKHKADRVGFLFNTGATGGAIAAVLLPELNRRGLNLVLSVGYSENALDLEAEVGRLSRAGITLLIHAAGPSETILFTAASRNLKFAPNTILGCDCGYQLRENLEDFGSSADRVKIVSQPFYGPNSQAISDAYEAKFGQLPRSPDSLSGYVAAKLAMEILKEDAGGSYNILDIIRKINLPLGKLENGFGVQFDRNGQNTRSFVLIQRWQNGGLIPEA